MPIWWMKMDANRLNTQITICFNKEDVLSIVVESSREIIANKKQIISTAERIMIIIVVYVQTTENVVEKNKTSLW